MFAYPRCIGITESSGHACGPKTDKEWWKGSQVWEYWPVVVEGLSATMTVTLTTFAISVASAIPLTILRLSRFRVLRSLATWYVELFRGIPPLTVLFIVFFGLPSVGVVFDPIEAAIGGLSLVGTAYITEIYRGALRAVPPGQQEGAAAVGLSGFQTYYRVIGPQAVRTAIPVLITYLIGLFKESALASTLGVVDITHRAVIEARAQLDGLQVFLAAAVLYLAISIPVGLFGRWLGGRIGRAKEASVVA
jgi:polar amino acid transport system permease protein